MSQADSSYTTNVIPSPPHETAPGLPAADDDAPASEREVIVARLEEHIANSERAVLILAAGIERQRMLLEQLKALDGMRVKIGPSPVLYGDAALFEDFEVRVESKRRKR